MEDEDDPQLKRIQKMLDTSPDARAPLKRIRAVLDAKAAGASDKRARTLAKASKSFVGPDETAKMASAADAYNRGPSLAERAKEAGRKAVEMAEQAHREAPLRRAREQLEFEQELERLRLEAKKSVASVHRSTGFPESSPASPRSAAVKVAAKRAKVQVGARLRKLKSESNLTWDTIARESGISGRRLYEISAGADPRAETTKTIRNYFSRILKRRIQL